MAKIQINGKDYDQIFSSGLVLPKGQSIQPIIPDDLPLQMVYFGAPGTGKSFEINHLTKDEPFVFRTTFHPDSDYSTFVGCYKPAMGLPKDLSGVTVPDLGIQENTSTSATGKRVVKTNQDEYTPLSLFGKEELLDLENEIKKRRDEITYSFIEQVFIKAYNLAWAKWFEAQPDNTTPEKVFLIIEEINRGDCSRIFGDIFQLLDRNFNGYSKYPIDADSDLRLHLSKTSKTSPFVVFNNNPSTLSAAVGSAESMFPIELEDENETGISADEKQNRSDRNSKAKASRQELITHIFKGEKLCLPSNMYIWATMNTSDQSLFPMDSAFKRRWYWKYIPIKKADANWNIVLDVIKGKSNLPDHITNSPDFTYPNVIQWWEFVKSVNVCIDKVNQSSDKKLGAHFIDIESSKAVDAEMFVCKVVFYLWNDIYKIVEESKSIFNFDYHSTCLKSETVGGMHRFESFFNEDGTVNIQMTYDFIQHVMALAKTYIPTSKVVGTGATGTVVNSTPAPSGSANPNPANPTPASNGTSNPNPTSAS